MRQLSKFNPEKLEFHSVSEKLASHLCALTENENLPFFRIIVAYHLSKAAAQMRATIRTHTNQELPINMYTIALAPSGYGKTRAMSFMEEQVMGMFMDRFKAELLPFAAEQNLIKLAAIRANTQGTDPDAALRYLKDIYEGTGEWVSAFDTATGPALKQFRQKLLMANAGALNFEVDEIGDNLTNNSEAFSKFLELYDRGNIKESLTKNTKDNTRILELKGSTPCNLIMFGTPSSLMDGSKKEDEFYAMLEKGYARRCLFAFTRQAHRNLELTAEEIYQRSISQQSTQLVEDLAEHMLALCDPINYQKQITLNKDEEILRIEYAIYCQDRAQQISEFEPIRRLEMENRAFKAIKLAATYAFIEGNSSISERNLYNAIALVEESGNQFQELLSRDQPYVKLAKFLGDVKYKVTQADLVEKLPFYKGTVSQKNEILNLAIAWGHQHHIIIKKHYSDGIEFLQGESLEETNLDELIVSYSDHVAYGYYNDEITWKNLTQLCTMQDMHWVSHHVLEGHRCEDKTKPGFNLLVIDVDGDVPLQAAQQLLQDYKCLFYTTKRHQQEGTDRFRIVMPMKYVLKLDATDYKEFMSAIYSWLPFEVDDQTNQRARKWLTNDKAIVIDNDGDFFDPLEFIPKTAKNEERKQRLLDQESLSNLERWFVNNTGIGNRSNQLIKFALLLVDSGKPLQNVEQAVLSLNEKLQDKLPESEIMNTIMVSARKHFQKLQTI